MYPIKSKKGTIYYSVLRLIIQSDWRSQEELMEERDIESKEPEPAVSPAARIEHLLVGYQATQALYAAARLGIFDVLHGSRRSLDEIAVAAGADKPPLRRLLRFLVTLDMLSEDNDGLFAATQMGDLLRQDHPESQYPWAVLLGSPLMWRSWGELYQSVLTGRPAFDRVFGQSLFEYLEQNSEEAAAFDAAMTISTIPSVPFDAYDLPSFTKIVDVGGGQGALLRSILERYPHIRGVLYDLPWVVAGAHELMNSAVADRCEIAGGDMFQSIPEGGDAYILQRIVHDWSDADAIRILKKCRQAMGDQGKVLLIEAIVQPSAKSDVAAAGDLMLLVLTTGHERTEDEFRQLYEAAGLRLNRVVCLGDSWIIEGLPA
jgi:hypothetical protein